MNCKVCGKELDKDAKFCSNCGCRVATEAVEETDLDKMGFVGESEKEKRQMIFHGYAQPEDNFEEKLAATKNITFDWDLDDFNSTKDIENIDFNWNEVVEKDSKKSSTDGDSLFTEEDIHRGEPVNFDWALGTTTRIEKEKLDNLENAGVYDIEELIPPEDREESTDTANESTVEEKPKRNIDKFYTFNKKNEEFQALLDEEYERLRQRIKEENEAENVIRDKQEKLEKARSQWENSNLEPVADDVDRMTNREDELVDASVEASEENNDEDAKLERHEYTPIQKEAEEQEFNSVDSNDIDTAISENDKEEPKVEITSTNHLDGNFAQAEAGVVAIVQPIGTTVVDLCKEDVSTTVKSVAATEPSKKRIKYSDIFEPDEEADEPIKPKKKEKTPKQNEVSNKKETSGKGKNIVLNIIIVILLIVMIISGILAFAPNSAPGQFIQGNIDKVKALFIKEEPVANTENQKTAMEVIIESESDNNKNIGKVEEGLNMGFSYTDDYGIEGLLDSSAFADSVWHTDSEGNTVNYGNAIVGSVISYFSMMVDHMNEGSKDILGLVDENSDLYGKLESQEKSSESYGISLLKIGEIRTIDNKYYVMVNVIEKFGDGEPEEKAKVVQLVASDKQMKVTAVTDI